MMRASVRMPPPPIPWIARNTINITMLVLSAHASEPSMKMMSEPSSTDLRPKMSLSRPYTGCSAVDVSMYAVPTQAEMAASLNTLPSVGRAVVTIVCSSSEQNSAQFRPMNMTITCRTGRRLVWSCSSNLFFFSPGTASSSSRGRSASSDEPGPRARSRPSLSS